MPALDGPQAKEGEERQSAVPSWDSDISELNSLEDSSASESDDESGDPTQQPPPRLTIRLPPRTGPRHCTRCMRVVPGVHRWKWCDQCRNLFRVYRQVRAGKLKVGNDDERDQPSLGELLDHEQSEIKVRKRKKRGTPVSNHLHTFSSLLILLP
jgi:hypothetical protein